MKKFLKQYWLVGLVVLGAAAIFAYYAVQSVNKQDAQQQLADLPECQDAATITADVLLVYVAETHPENPAIPGKYETAVKQLWTMTQVVPLEFKEPDSSLISKLKSPYPSEFLIGKVLSYTIERNFCKAPTDPVPKEPNPPTKPRPKN